MADRHPLFDVRHLTEARQEVAALRRVHPDESLPVLARRVVWRACLRAGAAGSATSALALIPVVGKRLDLAAGVLGNIALCAHVQRRMLLELCALYGAPLDAAALERAGRWLEWSSGGGELADQLGRSLLRRWIEGSARNLLRRGLPAIEVLYSGAAAVGATWLLARQAMADLAQAGYGDAIAVEVIEVDGEP